MNLSEHFFHLPTARWGCDYCRRLNAAERTGCESCGAPAPADAGGTTFVDAELLAAQHAIPRVMAGQMYPVDSRRVRP